MTDIAYDYRPFIYRAKNGTEIMIEVFVGDQADDAGDPALIVRMATRASRWETWGAPLPFEPAP